MIAGVAIASAVTLSSCGNKQAAPAAPSTVGGARIAWVNIDTLEEHYDLLKQRREEFRKRKDQMEGELQQSAQQMQAKAMDVQKKAQSGALTQSEYEAAQKQYMAMQQSLESRNQSLTEQLMKEQEDMNKELKKTLDIFLEKYNKDKNYDFILSYTASGGSPIMYANKAYEITNEVIKGMNAEPKPATKEEKKK